MIMSSSLHCCGTLTRALIKNKPLYSSISFLLPYCQSSAPLPLIATLVGRRAISNDPRAKKERSKDRADFKLPSDGTVSSAATSADATAEAAAASDGRDDDASDQAEASPLEPPTICCMSNCANCVWIEYAERLADHYRDGGEAARRAINQHVQDPSLRAFLLLELKTRRR